MPAADRLMWAQDRPMVWEQDSSAFWLFGRDLPVRVSGSIACTVAALIDGSRSTAEVQLQAATHGVSPMAAATVIRGWRSRGLVESAADDASAATATPLTSPEASALSHALRQRLSGPLSYLPLVLVDDLLDAGILHVPGPAVVVALEQPGPVVGVVECTSCLTHRAQLGRSYHLAAAARCGLPRPPLVPGDRDLAVQRAAELIAQLDGGETNVLLAWSEAGEPVRHVLLTVPGCPACDAGGASLLAEQRSAPSEVTIGAGVVTDSGGYREVTPESTWAAYHHLVSDLVGVVPWVRPQGETRLHVYVAGPNPAVNLGADPAPLLTGARTMSAGKGLTAESSRTGALCESLERYSLVYRGDEPAIRGSLDELGEQAIHPNRVALFSQRQLAEAAHAWDSAEKIAHRFFRVPRRFDPARPVEWTEAEHLTGGPSRLVPSSLVWFGHPDSVDGGYAACSNGSAAGNTVDEATLQGLLELIERDSVALWWYPRARRPGVDLAACEDPRIRQALAQIESGERRSWILDLTSDLDVPTYAAVNAHMDGSKVLFGFGAHVDPVIACVRALTEVAQFAGVLPAAGTFRSSNTVEDAWLTEVTTDTDPWLTPTQLIPLRSPPAMPSVPESLETLLDHLSRRGMEVLRVQATRRDIGLPVARVIVPGLRHFWNRFAPGRLYDVPRQLGWVPTDFGEDDLNPRWMFL